MRNDIARAKPIARSEGVHGRAPRALCGLCQVRQGRRRRKLRANVRTVSAKPQQKFAGKRVANRADARKAAQLGVDYCKRCRLVYVVSVDGSKRCACGRHGVVNAPNVQTALRLVKKQMPARRAHGLRRAFGIAFLFAVGIVAMFVRRARTGRWEK